MAGAPWVALVLLGNDIGDIEGVHHLCASIFHYEPEVVHVLLVCDSPETAAQTGAIIGRFGSRVSVTIAPPKHPTNARGQYIGSNVLHGLDLIENRFEYAFVLKLDADSLVIGPFSQDVSSLLERNPECGVCGTLGRTSARDHETYGFERKIISPLVTIISSLPAEQWAHISSLSDHDLLAYARSDPSLTVSLRAGGALAWPVQEAIRRGYSWLEYCQGGGYAISRPLVTAMRKSGYLGHGPLLYGLPTGEDVLISMYCRSLGFRVMDYSDNGQSFACMWRGLPYPVEVLLERNHAIIHSLKGDRHKSRGTLQSVLEKLRI